MIKNYLKIAFRHFTKNASFSFINLMGLSFGLAAAFAVMLYVQDELSYEAFHENAENIVRVNLEATFDGTTMKLGTAPNQAAPFLKENLPEIKEAVRVFPHNFGASASLRANNQNFVERNLLWADPNLTKVFTLNFTVGNPDEVLQKTNSVILSESAAERLFGDANPLGQTITVDSNHELQVTGVFEDVPSNTHLPFQVVGSFQTVPFGKPERLSWGNASFYTFLFLNSEQAIAPLEDKVADLLKSNLPEDRQWFELKLMPLLDLHLYSTDVMDETSYGDINQVWILIGLAIILVLIACINYMNLATAKSQQRGKEVAVNKTLGATRKEMALQFYTETGLLALGGIILSVIVLSLALPWFNNVADKSLSMSSLFNPVFLFGLIGIWFIITTIAGSYPALYLSSFTPATVLQKQKSSGFDANMIRRGLVVFQFCISIVLIISTLVLYLQLQYISNKKLGYNPEQVLAISVNGIKPRSSVETLQKELQQSPNVLSTSLAQTFPGHGGSGRSLSKSDAEDAPSGDLTTNRAHPEIFDALDIKFLAGRPIKVPGEQDSITQIVLNKSAVDYLGYVPEEAIGKRVNADLGASEIVGVTEDFHFGSLHNKIGYYAFHNKRTESLQYLLVKLNSRNLSAALDQMQSTFERVTPNTAFEYVFIDDTLDKLYRSERRLAKVVFIFAGLAIFIACLGLFALAAFATERRRKEIGIRKVLGASVSNIIGLLSKEFLQLVLVAFLIATPIAWYTMNRWLQDFNYRIDIPWWAFLVAGLSALTIAFLTVSFQSMKAATSNPTKALKTE